MNYRNFLSSPTCVLLRGLKYFKKYSLSCQTSACASHFSYASVCFWLFHNISSDTPNTLPAWTVCVCSSSSYGALVPKPYSLWRAKMKKLSMDRGLRANTYCYCVEFTAKMQNGGWRLIADFMCKESFTSQNIEQQIDDQNFYNSLFLTTNIRWAKLNLTASNLLHMGPTLCSPDQELWSLTHFVLIMHAIFSKNTPKKTASGQSEHSFKVYIWRIYHRHEKNINRWGVVFFSGELLPSVFGWE